MEEYIDYLQMNTSYFQIWRGRYEAYKSRRQQSNKDSVDDMIFRDFYRVVFKNIFHNKLTFTRRPACMSAIAVESSLMSFFKNQSVPVTKLIEICAVI